MSRSAGMIKKGFSKMSNTNLKPRYGYPLPLGLYHPAYEHDSCGVGFVANIHGQQEHGIIEKGIRILENLLHRGAIGGDLTTGDGAGILFQIPDEFFRKECKRIRIDLPQDRPYGVGMMFMPRDATLYEQFTQRIEQTIESEKLTFLGWRKVPVDIEAISGQARDKRPEVMQCFIDGNGLGLTDLERRLYIVRKQIEKKEIDIPVSKGCFYISSMSCRTIVYKGLFTAPQLAGFYRDLNDPDLTSAVAVVHQRYSTNTFPSWELAQPFRYLAHNGEINTLRGNIHHIRCRESSLTSDLF